MKLNPRAQLYISAVVMVGVACLVRGLVPWESRNVGQFLCYLAIALAASGLKVTLPGIDGTMSVNFLFILLGTVQLSLSETLLLGTIATVVQCYWRTKRKPAPVQLIFNIAQLAIAITLAYAVYHSPLRDRWNISMPVMLMATACVYFFANTLPVAAVIAITEGKDIRKIWSECYVWSFPYYLVGAGTAGTVSYLSKFVDWQLAVLVVPIIYTIYRSYRLYLNRLEDEKKHVEEIAALHLRTIEALALAIDAKDHTTHDHLQRVRIYAIEIANELNVSEEETEALRAAALLHDIGKLAVPEHIISKPGRLTPEEFEKLKIHPVVGAEILERVQFPYPVVPIVRAHHERWDGTGYPYGLRGEEIPVGARILAAVDCLDALASERQYKRAMPLDEAMQRVVKMSGASFDPRVVDVLKRRYVELEQMARAQSRPQAEAQLSTELKIERGSAPGAGFESSALQEPTVQASFVSSIAAARQEAQMLFELSNELGSSLSLDETLSVLSVRLHRMVPYDAIAMYMIKENRLVPEFVNGDNFRLFSSLQIPMGQGLSGWVAANNKPIINGNPSVEPGYLNDPTKVTTLQSALAVPIESVNEVIGVLTLYRADADSFTKDDLRVLLAISSKLGMSVQNALQYRIAESSATTDYLTGLPNARSLFLHLDQELARARRSKAHLAVLVCDLDGFKQINDRFGHLEGNKVLRAFADRLKDICREYDYVARMGGDEFVIIAPGLQPSVAAEKIQKITEIAIEVGRTICGDSDLSASVGEAYYPETAMDAEQLLSDADRRMYSVKQGRQNSRVHAGRVLQFQQMPARIV